nr:helix-hairpin-helix domain-containing protein [Candidatus Njordarchaeota archaeon]
MSIEKLSEIPGVGPKIAEKLVESLGSEEEALRAIVNANVATIASIPGIGHAKAVRIVRSFYEAREGATLEQVLRTQDATEIYERIMSIIRSYTKTDYASDKLSLYFPLPSNKLEVMNDRISRFTEARDIVEKIGNEKAEKISKCLAGIRSLKRWSEKRQIRGRIVLTDSEEILNELEKSHVGRYCVVRQLVQEKSSLDEEAPPTESARGEGAARGEDGIVEFAKAYDVVVFVSSGAIHATALEQLDNVEIIKRKWTMDQVVPESIVDFYSANMDVIKATCEISEIFRTLPDGRAMKEFKSGVDFKSLDEIKILIGSITEKGGIAEEAYPELGRLKKAIKNFNSVVNDVEAWANEEIRKRVGESNVTIRGEQIINILRAASDESIPPEELNRYLPSQVVETITETLTKGEESIVSKLNLRGDEEGLVEGVLPRKIGLPIEVDRRRVKELEDLLRREHAINEYRELRNLAGKLMNYMNTVQQAVQTILEFDLFFAIGQFTRDYRLSPPNLLKDKTGTGFRGAVNIFLKEEEFKKRLEVKPITYIVGNVSLKLPSINTKGERVILLSGANSGGKTCCIQTIAQIMILGQMGLPVPSEEAVIGLCDELYFFSKSKGIADAGAFEITLRTFTKVILSPNKKMVLVDELESITEPGAAAKVIGGILEKLSENPNTCAVFVSHLAEEISKAVKLSIRIDGIEAKGLDQNLNLVVDRNPILNHLAKSMPQLIITRLSALSKGDEKESYDHILAKFR